jgi:hypothetical protein
LNIVCWRNSPNTTLNQEYSLISLLLEGSFHSMFENRVYLLNKTRFSPWKEQMIVISDGDLIKSVDKTCNPSNWAAINVQETYMTTKISCFGVSITF